MPCDWLEIYLTRHHSGFPTILLGIFGGKERKRKEKERQQQCWSTIKFIVVSSHSEWSPLPIFHWFWPQMISLTNILIWFFWFFCCLKFGNNQKKKKVQHRFLLLLCPLISIKVLMKPKYLYEDAHPFSSMWQVAFLVFLDLQLTYIYI